jgi:hypothetical protein
MNNEFKSLFPPKKNDSSIFGNLLSGESPHLSGESPHLTFGTDFSNKQIESNLENLRGDVDKFNQELIKSKKDLSESKKEIEQLKVDLKNAKEEYQKERYDIVTIMAVFVGLITYLGLEIQVFKAIHSPLIVIGISIFFISSILLFVLTINIILKEETVTKKQLKNPLFKILIALFALAILLIVCGDVYDYKLTNPTKPPFTTSS